MSLDPGACAGLSQRFDFEGLLRALEERLATVPDFFVAEVRLVAAAARLAGFAELRDFADEDFTALRLALRAAGFLAVERADVLEALRDADGRADDFAAVFLAVVFLATVFLATVFLAEADLAAVFRALVLADDLAAVFRALVLADDFAAVVFLAAVFLAPVFAEDFTADFEVDLAAVFLAAVFGPAFLAAVLFEPAFDALLAALERDEVPVDFAALLRAVEAPVFLAPDLAEDFVPFAPLVELRRALLFFADFLVLVAPVSPVNSAVSGFDLSSVGIAASFKGLRVQPSRLQGNVVIPRGFRITESVDSRSRTFSVDTFARRPACTCSPRARHRSPDATRRDFAWLCSRSLLDRLPPWRKSVKAICYQYVGQHECSPVLLAEDPSSR